MNTNNNIQTAFRKALRNTSWANSQWDPDFLLGTCAAASSPLFQNLSLLLAGGFFTSVSSFTCEFQQLDCFLLLYTKEGAGRLTLEQNAFSLTKNSLVLFHGAQHFSLSLVQSPWKFYLYYLDGRSLESWHQVLGEHCFYLTQFPLLPVIEPVMEHLSALLPRTDTGSLFTVHRILTDFFTELSLWNLPESENNSVLPPHVAWMKCWCETYYPEHFSLDEMAEWLKMSKYKICRDFSEHMHISPLQYLNHQRMEAAKLLLTDTDLCVYEVGNAVGIENTNHFINLFKKFTGTTPSRFRQLHQSLE